jgi:(R)-2-hydroxyacyl-CoA dehydratese activating ATPase
MTQIKDAFKLSEIIGERAPKFRSEHPVLGLDLGSRASKAVLLHKDFLYATQIPTGYSMQETADELLEKLTQKAGVTRQDLRYIVGTGYGRITLKYDDIAYKVVTEITCHAMGSHVLYPKARTIIDIGGQDSKAIKVDPESGKVVEFVMNDKCAAGTGRFLEKAAQLLGIDLAALGQYSLKATDPSPISSQCVVFAESEMISLRARGKQDNPEESLANIAAGIHYSSARRVKNLLGRVGIDSDLVFSGGVSNNPGMWKVLEDVLGAKFAPPAPVDMIFAGALGASVFASRYASKPVHHAHPKPVLATA